MKTDIANKEQISNFLRNFGAASVGECNMKIWFREWICSDECIRSDEGLTLETSAFFHCSNSTFINPFISSRRHDDLQMNGRTSSKTSLLSIYQAQGG